MPGNLRRIFRIRFDKSAIQNVENLTEFIQTRSAYVAQTSLYGYLKTRMGTRFRQVFEDDKFLPSINQAKWRTYGACLSDLTVFAAALTGAGDRLGEGEIPDLARKCFQTAVRQTFEGEGRGSGSVFAALMPGNLRRIFRIRFDKSAIQSVENLTEFLQTRSAYVAQTSLYGYLKTRMGTRFRQVFEDDKFLPSINQAKWRTYGACLSDLTVFAAALTGAGDRLGEGEIPDLARKCFQTAVRQTFEGEGRGSGSVFAALMPGNLRRIFRIRFDKSAIQSVENLTEFLQTRSAYVAQTSLYGYLKTRMGTRFRQVFEDDKFLPSINQAKWRTYGACLSDLTVFAAALTGGHNVSR